MKEQITRLNRTPGTEVQSGVLQSGVTQTSNMPFVQQGKTKGQRLSEAFGLIVNAGTKIVKQQTDIKNKQQATIDDIEYTTYADKVANNSIEEIEQLPADQREQAYIDRLHSDIENFKNQYKNNSISEAAFKAYVGTISNKYQAYADKSRQIKLANIAADSEEKVKQYITNPKFSKYSDIDIDTASKAYGVSKNDLAKYWLDFQLANVKSQYLNGFLTPKGAITAIDNAHKSMSTKDNPNVWKNATYIKAVNTAKAQLLSEQSSLDAKNEKQVKDLYVETASNFKAQLLNVPNQEMFNRVLADALSSTIKGNMRWSDYVSVIESSREGKYDIRPSAPITDNSFVDLKMTARTDSNFDYDDLASLEKAGNLTSTQVTEITALIKERKTLERTLANADKSDANKAKSESWTRGNKLIATVTKQGMMLDPTMKDKADEMNLEYLDRVTKGEDAYTVARELTTRYFPNIEGRIETTLKDRNPTEYLNRKYGVLDMSAAGFGQAFTKLESRDKKKAFQKDLLELQQKGEISLDEYVEFYKLFTTRK